MTLNSLARRVYRFLKSGSVKSRPYLEYFENLKNRRDGLGKAQFNLTVDFELAWSRARRGNGATSPQESLERARLIRMVFQDFIALGDEYKLPATFAVVARLLVNDQTISSRAPVYAPSWFGQNWHELGANIDSGQLLYYYGFDLFESIKKSPVLHEIASHGFSHIDLSDEQVTREIAEFEISESAKILRDFNNELFSFIFPNNNFAFLDLVKSIGFKAYRTRRNESVRQDNMGLWQFPVGLWLSPLSFSPKEAIALIDLAIKNKNLVNFYCHLYEFKSPKQMVGYFTPIFKYLKKKKKIKKNRHYERYYNK